LHFLSELGAALMSPIVGEPIAVDPYASNKPEPYLNIDQITLKIRDEDEIEDVQRACQRRTLLVVGTIALMVELVNTTIVVYDIVITHGSFRSALSFSLFRKLKVLPLINLVCCFVGITCACSKNKVPTGCDGLASCASCPCIPWSITILGILRLPEMIIVVVQYLKTRDDNNNDAAFEWTLIAIGFLYAIVLRFFGFYWLRRCRRQNGYWCCIPGSLEPSTSDAQDSTTSPDSTTGSEGV
jgi:cytochrome bd-type quinol oxidase subunit 2